MKHKPTTGIRSERAITALALAGCLLPAGTALAQSTERPVKLKDLPAAVQTTVREQSQGATMRGLAEEVKDGQTFYEVSLRVKGRNRDVLMDTNGNLVETEEQVTLAALPPAPRAAIVKQAGKGKILMVESITKNRAIVAYEAHVRRTGKIVEIKVDPDGKPLPVEPNNQ
jgi:uncharacterized cupredoxin-like copper-binding protein